MRNILDPNPQLPFSKKSSQHPEDDDSTSNLLHTTH
jgi:hypothetical protein